MWTVARSGLRVFQVVPVSKIVRPIDRNLLTSTSANYEVIPPEIDNNRHNENSDLTVSFLVKILATTAVSIVAGIFMGPLLVNTLGKDGMDIFTYTPDDDDKDEDDDEKSKTNTRIDQVPVTIYGDFKLNIPYTWGKDIDGAEIAYRKNIVNQQIEDLELTIKKKGEEKLFSAVDLREANLLKSFVVSQMKIELEREKLLSQKKLL
ncbi:hypothetical protein HK096_003626 [Nowakowskiella sp. JEL0078]|nr:hypothetical protein HK096_003626 [Nowakowskiella sp. JEL0078]